MRPYLRQVRGLLVAGSAAGFIMNTCVVLPALLLGQAVDTVVEFDAGRATAADLTWAALLLVAGALATELPRVGKRYWLGTARARIRAALRTDAHRGVLHWPAYRLSRTPVGDVIARTIGDVEVVATGIGEVVVETWDTVLFSAALAVAMIAFDPTLTLLAMAPVPVALLLAKWTGRNVAQRTTEAREANATLTEAISEQLAAVRLLTVSGRTAEVVAQIRQLAEAQARAQLASVRLASTLQPVYGVLTVSGVLAVIWVGGHRVVNGAMTVGALVAFLQLFSRFAGRAWRLPQMANRVQAAAAAYERVRPLLAPAVGGAELAPYSTWRSARIPAPRRQRYQSRNRPPDGLAVRFDAVSFTYPGARSPALVGLTLDVPAGTLTAITGSVASGKTSLARLAAGLDLPNSGRVLVGSVDTSSSAPELRAGVGFVPQGYPVFSGSIVDNLLLFGPGLHSDSVRARLAAAIDACQLGPDLTALPRGLESDIGEEGIRVSGGQRQRIALARALAAPAAPPRLLILDDPFSAVDGETEAAIVAALRTLTGPRAPAELRCTIVLCSSRLASFGHADQIVVLDRGRIRELGTHHELMAADGLYARIRHAQRLADHARPAAAP